MDEDRYILEITKLDGETVVVGSVSSRVTMRAVMALNKIKDDEDLLAWLEAYAGMTSESRELLLDAEYSEVEKLMEGLAHFLQERQKKKKSR